jgi:hypothetical protein
VTVEYADPEPNGLASMVGTLIEQNVEREPSRVRLLRPGVATIVSSDADVGITLRTAPSRVLVANGTDSEADLRIEADSQTLLALTAAPLRFGLPDPFDRRGLAVLLDVLRRRVRIRGLVRHPRRLARLTTLLSVS